MYIICSFSFNHVHICSYSKDEDPRFENQEFAPLGRSPGSCLRRFHGSLYEFAVPRPRTFALKQKKQFSCGWSSN